MIYIVTAISWRDPSFVGHWGLEQPRYQSNFPTGCDIVTQPCIELDLVNIDVKILFCLTCHKQGGNAYTDRSMCSGLGRRVGQQSTYGGANPRDANARMRPNTLEQLAADTISRLNAPTRRPSDILLLPLMLRVPCAKDCYRGSPHAVSAAIL
jgi:hypothetical protein